MRPGQGGVVREAIGPAAEAGANCGHGFGFGPAGIGDEAVLAATEFRLPRIEFAHDLVAHRDFPTRLLFRKRGLSDKLRIDLAEIDRAPLLVLRIDVKAVVVHLDFAIEGDDDFELEFFLREEVLAKQVVANHQPLVPGRVDLVDRRSEERVAGSLDRALIVVGEQVNVQLPVRAVQRHSGVPDKSRIRLTFRLALQALVDGQITHLTRLALRLTDFQMHSQGCDV